MRMLTWAVLLGIILNITLAGEENSRGASRSIADIAGEVQTENLEMIRAERAIRDAERDLEGEKSLENSVVSAGAGKSPCLGAAGEPETAIEIGRAHV